MFSVVLKVGRADVELAINLTIPKDMKRSLCRLSRKISVYVVDGRTVRETGRGEAIRELKKHLNRWAINHGTLQIRGTDNGLLVANIKGRPQSLLDLEHIGETIPYEKVLDHILAVESKSLDPFLEGIQMMVNRRSRGTSLGMRRWMRMFKCPNCGRRQNFSIRTPHPKPCPKCGKEMIRE